MGFFMPSPRHCAPEPGDYDIERPHRTSNGAIFDRGREDVGAPRQLLV